MFPAYINFLLVCLAVNFATAQRADGQYWPCNPTVNVSCPPVPGLPQSTYTVDFTSLKAQPANWTLSNYNHVSYGPDGAEFTFAKRYDAPQLWTDFNIFFGRVDVLMKAAPGQGIISSSVLISDDFDEIDWEWSGNNFGFTDSKGMVQNNYFGKGVTGTYDRGIFINISSPQTLWHTYSVDWNPTRLQWLIDGQVVRTLNAVDCKDNAHQYPQSPSKYQLGLWDGGDADENPGTVSWAGGHTDLSKAPFTMYVKKVTITNMYPAYAYNYSDRTGSWESIKQIQDSNWDAASTSSAVKAGVTSSTSRASSPVLKPTGDTMFSSSAAASASAASGSGMSSVVGYGGVSTGSAPAYGNAPGSTSLSSKVPSSFGTSIKSSGTASTSKPSSSTTSQMNTSAPGGYGAATTCTTQTPSTSTAQSVSVSVTPTTTTKSDKPTSTSEKAPQGYSTLTTSKPGIYSNSSSSSVPISTKAATTAQSDKSTPTLSKIPEGHGIVITSKATSSSVSSPIKPTTSAQDEKSTTTSGQSPQSYGTTTTSKPDIPINATTHPASSSTKLPTSAEGTNSTCTSDKTPQTHGATTASTSETSCSSTTQSASPFPKPTTSTTCTTTSGVVTDKTTKTTASSSSSTSLPSKPTAPSPTPTTPQPLCTPSSTPYYPPTPTSGFSLLCNIDLPGRDITHFSAPDFATCLNSCITHPDNAHGADKCCDGVAFLPDTQVCYLKNFASGVPKANVAAYRTYCAVREGYGGRFGRLGRRGVKHLRRHLGSPHR